jgi:hypothetical protein
MATLSRISFKKKVHETNPEERYRVLDVFHTRIPAARADQLICLPQHSDTDLCGNKVLIPSCTRSAKLCNPSGVDHARIRCCLLIYSSFPGSRLVLRCVSASKSNCDIISFRDMMVVLSGAAWICRSVETWE